MFFAIRLGVPASDRNFRMLGRDEPPVVAALVRAVVPGILPSDLQISPEDVVDPGIDLGTRRREADWVALFEPAGLLHVEAQGYRDPELFDRIVDYHAALYLRFHHRVVHTVVVWFIVPPPEQRTQMIRSGNLVIHLHTVVIPEFPAERLLQDPLSACFAPAANPGDMSEAELCLRVARLLKDNHASLRQWTMALRAADMVGRYKLMADAARKVDTPPVIIEELYQLMHEKGIEEGIEKGIEKGELRAARAALRRVLIRRKLPFGPSELARIETCEHLPTLERWHDQALDAQTTVDALA